MMNIREATLADIAGIRAVGVAAWYDTYPGMVPDDYIPWALGKWWTPDTLERYIRSDQFIVLVADQGPQIVGMAHAQVRPDRTAILWRLYVGQAYRGEGIGTRLLKAIQVRLPPETRLLYVEYYQQNERAAAFYAARGFVFDRIETTHFADQPIVSVFVKRTLAGA